MRRPTRDPYARPAIQTLERLHAELGGILTPAKMDLSWLQAHLSPDAQAAERMSRLSALIDQGIDLKRRVIEDLHPSLLDHLGLASAVQWFMEETCGAAKIECSLVVSPQLERLDPDREIAIYRIIDLPPGAREILLPMSTAPTVMTKGSLPGACMTPLGPVE